MRSIFDEEDALLGYAVQVGRPGRRRVGTAPTIVVSVGTDLTYRSDNNRKRTVGEALQRIYDASPPDLEALSLYGLARPARKPFMIYNAARVVAAGLVIIDPLNRLEGGIVD